MTAVFRNPESKLNGESPIMALAFIVGFYFAFRLISVLLSVRFLGLDPQTGTAVNLSLDFLLLFVVMFCCAGRASYPLKLIVELRSVRWASLFLGFTFLSLLWSNTASLAYSTLYWCAMAADVAIVIMLLQVGPLSGATDSLMKGFVGGACGVALIAWILPAESDLRLGDEELLGPNQIGYVCALAFFFAQYLMRKKKGTLIGPSLLLAITLLRSLSKTTIAAFLIAEGWLLMRDRTIGRRNKILVVLTAVMVIAGFWGLLASYYDIYTNAGNQSETLTGRLGIWAYFLGEAVEKPWIGHGFNSVWKVVPPFGPDQFEAAHAHNEVVQLFYAYGVVGIALFAGVYGSFLSQIRRLDKGPDKTFFLAFLLFILVRGTGDTERFDLSLPLWAIVMFSLLIEQTRGAVAGLAAGLHGERSHVRAGPQPYLASPRNLT
jgi:O-antigen ligase